jgi:hypothetical protein
MLKIGCGDMAADDMAIGELTDWRCFVITYITQLPGTPSLETTPLCRRRQLNNIISAQIWGDVWIRFQHSAQQNISVGMERRLIHRISGPNLAQPTLIQNGNSI